ncbi:hypothetical protein EMIT0P44_160057 [Pseudomonas sp. IT-P44]
MFCLSRRANVVESFSDGKLFLQNFHVLSGLEVPGAFRAMANLPISGFVLSYIERGMHGGSGGLRLPGGGKGDWRVSHGALPGLRRWVTSAPTFIQGIAS